MFANFDWLEAMKASPILLILVACSIVTLGVTLERTIYFLKRRANIDATGSRVHEKLRSGEIKEAEWICSHTEHPFGPVALEAFRHAQSPKDIWEERIQVRLSEQKLLLERNLGLIGTMAAVAPLIGLLGTVVGIMRAFHDMGVTGSSAPSVVAAGVAEALLTTAAGLVVAVPSVLLYNHFVRRMNVMLTEAENNVRGMKTLISEAVPTQSQAGPPSLEGSPSLTLEKTTKPKMPVIS